MSVEKAGTHVFHKSWKPIEELAKNKLFIG